MIYGTFTDREFIMTTKALILNKAVYLKKIVCVGCGRKYVIISNNII